MVVVGGWVYVVVNLRSDEQATIRGQGRSWRLSGLGQQGARRWWGDLYELCPDELNGDRDYAKVTALLRKYRAQELRDSLAA